MSAASLSSISADRPRYLSRIAPRRFTCWSAVTVSLGILIFKDVFLINPLLIS